MPEAEAEAEAEAGAPLPPGEQAQPQQSQPLQQQYGLDPGLQERLRQRTEQAKVSELGGPWGRRLGGGCSAAGSKRPTPTSGA